MPKAMRAVDPARLPHDRPCWCSECQKAYGQAWRALDGNSHRYSPTTYSHACIMCGTKYANGSKNSSHCSQKCRSASSVRIAFCSEAGCDRSFPKTGGRLRCDEHFVGKAPAKQRREIVHCKYCLEPFSRLASHDATVVCGKSCRDKLSNQIRRYGTANQSRLNRCIVCEVVLYSGPKSVYCQTHRRRSADQQKVADGRSNLKNFKRRSVIREGDSDITIAGLRHRDGDDCALCGSAIDFNAPQSADLAPEIDHIIPIARDGGHTWDNVQLAHGKCNRKKGARLIPDQPTLFDFLP